MQEPERAPERLTQIPEDTRKFLAGLRAEELENFRRIAMLRPEARERLIYVAEHFSQNDLETIGDNLENFRAMKRLGHFGLWLAGFIVAGAGAAAALKTFFTSGGPR